MGFDARRTASILDAMSSDKVASPARAKTSKPAKQKLPSDALQILLAYLADHPKNRPAKIETLKNHLTHIHSLAITDQQKDALIAELVSKGFAVITGKKIEYKITGGK
jgi:uncharacterized membrane protein YvbJ